MPTSLFGSFSLPRVFFMLAWAARAFGADPVVIAGASATDGIAITSTSSTITYPIFLQNTTNAAIAPVKVEITDLVGPDSQLHTATLKDPQNTAAPGVSLTVDLPALRAVRIILDTNVSLAGAYQTSLALVYGNKRYPIPLKITRSSVAPTVRLAGFDSVAFEGFDTRSIRFSLKEIGGAKVTMRPPTLAALSMKNGDKTLQAKYDSVKMFQVNTDATETLIAAPFDVAGNTTATIRMEFAGLNKPGEYTASLDIGSADGSLSAQTVSIFVKCSVLLAGLLIALGVGISFLIRKYTRVDRPRLLLRRKILLLETDVEAMRSRMPDDADRILLTALRERLTRTEGEVELGLATSIDDILNDVNAKLSLVPDFSTLRRKIDTLQPQSLADPVRPALQAASEMILATANATAQQLKDTGDALRNAVTTLVAAVRTNIAKQIADVQAAVKDAPPLLTDTHREEFASQVTAVLAQANDAAQRTPPDLETARNLIDQARRSAARIMVNDLQEKLVKPDEMQPDAWTPLEKRFDLAASKTRAAATGDDALNAYRDADEAWLSATIEAAASQAAAVQERAKAAVEPEKKALADKMQQQLNALTAARTQVRTGDLASAHKTFNAAKDAIVEGLKALLPTPSPRPMDVDASPRATRRLFSLFASPEIIEIPGLTLSSSVEPVPGRELRAFSSVRSIEKQVENRDRLVAVITGIVAVFLGIFLLWVDNLTWGSVKDMFVAVLWGLGVHQIAGNAAFAWLDLGTLEGQLAGATPAAGSNAPH